MNIQAFFQEKNIDAYAVLDVSDVVTPAGFHPRDLLPSSKKVVIFAKQIPRFVFEIDNRAKTNYLYSLIREMDRISFELSEKLNREGAQTIPIPSFFPVKLKIKKLRGYLSLKHLAEQAGMGSIGLNSLLISEQYGNRLCLAAILTEKDLTITNQEPQKPLCLKCNKCLESCPAKAISNGKVEVTRCINFSNQIPKFIRPLFKLLMKWNPAQKYIEILINAISWDIEMVCSECLVKCSYFKIGSERLPPV